MKKSLFNILAGALAFASNAAAYFVGPALTLDKVADEADIIFKGTCESGASVEDEWFKPYSGFESIETSFKVVSVIKGDPSVEALKFRHYDVRTGGMFFIGGAPQSYHFEQGRTYLIFAKSSGPSGAVRQLWMHHTGKGDQGGLACSDDSPVSVSSIKDVIWSELRKLVESDQPGDVVHGITQMDTMSVPKDVDADERFYWHDSTQDFDRSSVLEAMVPLLKSENDAIAQRAIAVIGSRNPFMSVDRVYYWLATLGGRDASRIQRMNAAMKNPGGTLYQTQLVSVVDDTHRSSKTRAAALQALGLVRGDLVLGHLEQWLKDSEPLVRSAASLLLADAPMEQAAKLLSLLVEDPAAEVRASVAYAMGIGRHADRVPTLGRMLKDPDAKVRRAASVSLLSFSPKDAAVAAVFQANLGNKEFHPLFLNALAADAIEPYLDAVAAVVEEQPSPTNWPGGTVPAFTAWKLLFQYLVARSPDELRGGKFDQYLDAMENGYVTGSSEPTKIYAFYLQRGLTERACKYREVVKKRVSYDMDIYFDRVDADPKSERF